MLYAVYDIVTTVLEVPSGSMSDGGVCGRLASAGSLLLASRVPSRGGQTACADIRQILTWYVVVRLIALSALALAMRRIQLDPVARDTAPLPE